MSYFYVILPIIIIPFLVAFIDFVTVIRSRFIKPKEINYEIEDYANEDFTVLVPIFGDLKYLKNIDYLKQYGNKVVLCTTTKETPHFNSQIEKVAKQYGFKVFQSEVKLFTSKHKPNPWRLFRNTLNSTEAAIVTSDARDEIIKDSFDVVQSEYCIFIDGDTVTPEHLGKLVKSMREHQYDISSVRVLASKQDTIMEKLQGVEYELAMDARKIYPWLTSGAGMIAKTKVIQSIMHHHSLFFSGGDIEIGKIAALLKYKVGHIPFIFYTDVPETFKGWFKQRMAWFGGGFRHAVMNMHQFTWKHPFHFIYFTIIVYLLFPLRIYDAIKYPEILLIVIVIYWLLLYTFHWKKRKWYFLLFPFYALTQVMVIVPCGVYTYIKMAITSRNYGRISLRHREHRNTRLKSHHIHFNRIGGVIAGLLCIAVVGFYSYYRMSRESSIQRPSFDYIGKRVNNLLERMHLKD